MSDTSKKRQRKPTDVGQNRTGIATSPVDAKKTIEGAIEGSPSPSSDATAYSAAKLEESADAGPYGSMPPPATMKGLAKTAIEALKGEKATVLIDQLAARLAFERGGVRLYEALLVKFEASDQWAGGPTREEIEEICDDELRHVGVLIKAIRELGADPTAMTPGANLVGTMTMGLVQVLNDPRTTFTQGLEAIHTAELTDNDCWDQLIDLVGGLGMDDLAANLNEALQDERDHLVKVRAWLAEAVRGQAGIEPSQRVESTDANISTH